MGKSKSITIRFHKGEAVVSGAISEKERQAVAAFAEDFKTKALAEAEARAAKRRRA